MNNTLMDASRRPRVYIAAPLFSQAEQRFNTDVREALSPFVDIYLPQEDGGLLTSMVGSGVSLDEATERVFSCDLAALRACDGLVIILDGRTIDEGAAFELGFAHALGVTCFGLQTDTRREIIGINNPMIQQACSRIVHDIAELTDVIQAWSSGLGLARTSGGPADFAPTKPTVT